MEFNQKALQILKILQDNEGQCGVNLVLKQMQVTRRVLNYQISKINVDLKIGGYPMIVNKNQMLYLSKKILHELLNNVQTESYVFSNKERQNMILILIALDAHIVTLEYLMDNIKVSRNTIVSDLHEVKSAIHDFGMHIVNKAHQGYVLHGDETIVRYHIMECIYSFSALGHAFPYIEEIVNECFSYDIAADFNVQDMRNMLSFVSDHYALHNTSESIEEIAYHIMIALLRTKAGHSVQMYEEIAMCDEHTVANFILQALQEKNIFISDNPSLSSYLTIILLSCQIYKQAAPKKDKIDLNSFTKDLLNAYEARACVSFVDRESFVERLLLHIRPMYYRMKYHIKIKNALKEEILSKYQEVYQMTYLSIRSIESTYDIFITDDEIAYICVYLAGWIENSRINNEHNLKVILICNLGNSVSMLIRQQVLAILGDNICFTNIFVKEHTNYNLNDWDLILASESIKNIESNVILINPILTQLQKGQLLDWKLSHTKTDYDPNYIKNLLQIIRKHAQITNEQNLRYALMEFITNGNHQKNDHLKSLLDILTLKHIGIHSGKISLHDCIRKSCEPFLKDDLIDYEHLDSILEVLDTFGTYGEITKGILLVHANKNAKANDVGIHISLLKHPVLTDTGKRIHVLLTLITPDNTSHIQVLKDILSILTNDVIRQKLVDCDYENEKILFNEIVMFLRPSLHR